MDYVSTYLGSPARRPSGAPQVPVDGYEASRPITDPEAAIQFARDVDRSRGRGRAIGAYLVCDRCHFSVEEREARLRGLTACPHCGNQACRVLSLPYNTAVPENPLPTLGEAEALSRAQAPKVR